MSAETRLSGSTVTPKPTAQAAISAELPTEVIAGTATTRCDVNILSRKSRDALPVSRSSSRCAASATVPMASGRG